jgi:hypothetical protein
MPSFPADLRNVGGPMDVWLTQARVAQRIFG